MNFFPHPVFCAHSWVSQVGMKLMRARACASWKGRVASRCRWWWLTLNSASLCVRSFLPVQRDGASERERKREDEGTGKTEEGFLAAGSLSTHTFVHSHNFCSHRRSVAFLLKKEKTFLKRLFFQKHFLSTHFSFLRWWTKGEGEFFLTFSCSELTQQIPKPPETMPTLTLTQHSSFC